MGLTKYEHGGGGGGPLHCVDGLLELNGIGGLDLLKFSKLLSVSKHPALALKRAWLPPLSVEKNCVPS